MGDPAEEERLLPAAHAARQADSRRASRREDTAAQIAAGGIEFIVLEYRAVQVALQTTPVFLTTNSCRRQAAKKFSLQFGVSISLETGWLGLQFLRNRLAGSEVRFLTLSSLL